MLAVHAKRRGRLRCFVWSKPLVGGDSPLAEAPSCQCGSTRSVHLVPLIASARLIWHGSLLHGPDKRESCPYAAAKWPLGATL